MSKIVSELGLEQRIVELVDRRPILIATWKGADSTLPSVLLNSHTDVVPVYADKWDYDPFEAFKDHQGRIYGRGTQDMKCGGESQPTNNRSS